MSGPIVTLLKQPHSVSTCINSMVQSLSIFLTDHGKGKAARIDPHYKFARERHATRSLQENQTHVARTDETRG